MDRKFLRGDKVALAVILLVVTIGFASAIPGVPHQFWGSVTNANGNTVADGTLIVAKINGQDVSATTTKDGSYGLAYPKFYVQDPDGNRDGKTIEFFVKGVKATQYSFTNGATTELNLIYSGGGSPGGNSGGGSGGGGGSSSSGGGAVVLTTNQSNATTSENCEENWECSEWLDCVGTIQKRVCTDTNSCGTQNNKPEEQRECKSEELQQSFFGGITGAVVGLVKEPGKGALVLVILAVAIGAVVFISKKRKK